MERDIPTPERTLDKPFLMSIEDTFSIAGRGTVATGRIEQGSIKTGEVIDVVGFKEAMKTTVTGMYICVYLCIVRCI